MEFRDHLRKLIEDNGGMTQDGLQRIVQSARKVAPDFTLRYLSRLLEGYPPRAIDRQAVSHALEADGEQWLSQFWPLEDDIRRRIARFAAPHLKSHVVIKKFVDFVESRASFRFINPEKGELRKLLNEFQPKSELEDEIELFGLSIEDE